MTLVGQRMTLEEFLELPEQKPALEFLDGVITQKVAKTLPHGLLQPKAAEFINRFAEPRRLAVAFTGSRMTFAGASLVPDVGVCRWEDLPRDAEGELEDGHLHRAWDVVIEIRSPAQRRSRLVRRCRWFLEHGTEIALLVDRHDRSVTLFRPDGSETVLRGDDRIDLDSVLPGFELTVQALFDTLRLE
jgi:Uma2 family endonuclease